MKPNEFGDCTYREASLFASSFNKYEETKLKNQIILFEKATDKIIKMNAFAKHPKYTSLIKDEFSDLFKEEIEEAVKNGNITMLNEQQKNNFIMELQEELKRGEGL